MASVFAGALSQATALLTKVADAVVAPAQPALPQIVIDKTTTAEVKKQLGGSIAKMMDGSFRAIKIATPFTVGASVKLFGTETGSLTPPASEIDISQIDSIALGVLSSRSDTTLFGVNSKLAVRGVPTTMHASIARPFTEVLLDVGGTLTNPMAIEDALKLCNIQLRLVGVARVAAASITVREGLSDPAAARSAVLASDAVVGSASAFTTARSAQMVSLQLLQSDGRPSPSWEASIGEIAGF